MSHYSKYIGLEFAEKGRGPAYDCWGLCIYVLEEQQGIQGLPDFRTGYHSTTDKVCIPRLVDKEQQNWEKVEAPQEGDVILFALAGKPMHVGIMIDKQQFLHITRGINACIEKISSPVWVNRIQGFYRYEH